ncbi:MAG: phage tail assembly chaperone [Pseudomonadota bacterium]
MAAGFGVLGLAPSTFWAMTPREFAAAVRGLTGDAGAEGAGRLERGVLDDLMARFPDAMGHVALGGAADERGERADGRL